MLSDERFHCGNITDEDLDEKGEILPSIDVLDNQGYRAGALMAHNYNTMGNAGTAIEDSYKEDCLSVLTITELATHHALVSAFHIASARIADT